MKTTMKLMERILLPGILPEKAKYEIGIVINDIRKKIAITQEEVTRTKLTTLPSGGMQWDASKDRAVEIEFTDAETEIIRGAFQKTSDNGELSTDPAMMKMYKDFVIDAGAETKENKSKIKKLK